MQIAESSGYSLATRGSVQTTFRTPSLDDLNETPLTTLEWINQTGAYQAVDRFGQKDLKPERAFTYNAGLILFTQAGLEATLDYWAYDFENVIGAMPYTAVTSLYENPLTRDAVARHIICPDGRASEIAVLCAATELVQHSLWDKPVPSTLPSINHAIPSTLSSSRETST